MAKDVKSKDPIRAAIYCRVSTYNQSQGDYSSLDTQEDLLRNFAKVKGWEIYDAYIDTKTGTTIEREHLTRLLKDAADKKFDVVIATKLDRISRSIKDFFEINEILASNDIDLVLATQNIDTTSSMGRFNRNVLMAFAEFERDMIAERTKEKLFSQAQKGYWGGGLVPLGYDVVDKRLVINEVEAKLVNRIFQYYLEEPSSYKVAARLNREGYKTKSRKSKDGNLSGGGPFTGQTIQLLLKNRVYIGFITYKDEEFKGLHKPIVEIERFNEVQREIANSQVNRTTTKTGSELLLLGLTKCGFCGKQLTTSHGTSEHGGRYYYYKCSTKSKHGSSQCESSDFPADTLETLVEKVLVHLGEDDDFFDAVFLQISENGDKSIKEIRDSLDDLNRNLITKKKQIGHLVNFLAGGGASSPAVQEQLAAFEEEAAAITARIAELEEKKRYTATDGISKERLKQYYVRLASIYKDLPTEKKKLLAKTSIAYVDCFLKRKENKGLLKFELRGNRSLEVDYFKKQKLEPESSSFHIRWLRR